MPVVLPSLILSIKIQTKTSGFANCLLCVCVWDFPLFIIKNWMVKQNLFFTSDYAVHPFLFWGYLFLGSQFSLCVSLYPSLSSPLALISFVSCRIVVFVHYLLHFLEKEVSVIYKPTSRTWWDLREIRERWGWGRVGKGESGQFLQKLRIKVLCTAQNLLFK